MATFTPKERYWIRVTILMAIYLLSGFAARYLIADVGVARPLALAAAAVPGLAIGGVFYSALRLIAETRDEFLRMLAVRQHLIAAGFALAVASVWVTLEMFRLVPPPPTVFLFPAWAIGLVVGGVCNRITHGVWDTGP